VTDEAPLLAAENDDDHPQAVAVIHEGTAVVLIDSARYCDSRNRGQVLVAASYGGTLPARLVAPHRPRGALFHDVGIAADGSGIMGLAYLEALGIPAGTVDGSTGELGNARDMYDNGRVSRVNILAERAGVRPGQPVAEAAHRLAVGDPGDVTATTKVRRKVEGEPVDGHRIVVTDSIVFAWPQDRDNVLVTAGHTGSTGARFIEAVSPWGFVCADGGTAKNGSGYAGLARLDDSDLPGACYDVMTAAMGDAFDAWDRGLISQVNRTAAGYGLVPGQTVQEAAIRLLHRTGQ
jgi:hypothetical protein